MISALLDTTKVLRKLDLGGAPFELCAEAVAQHERSTGQLTVNLSAFLRAEQHDHIAETETPGWLPAPEIVTEQVNHDEAHALANDVFASWCHRVAAAVPG